MNFRKYNSHLDETWYDRRSRQRNPERNNSLEHSIQTPLNNSPEKEYHGNSLKYFVNNIFSIIPVPVTKTVLTVGLLGAIAACGGQEVTSPTRSPERTATVKDLEATIEALRANDKSQSSNEGPIQTMAPDAATAPIPAQEPASAAITVPSPINTPEIKIDFDKLSKPNIPTIINDGIYKVIFPFKEPSSSLENFVYNNTGIITYMKFVRAKEGIKWAVSLANTAMVNISEYPGFIGRTLDLQELTPFVPLEDFLIFQQSTENYQGTRIPAEEEVYQKGPNNELIKMPNNNPDIDNQKYRELIQAHLNQLETHPLEWTMQEGPSNSGYVDISINLPLEKVWDLELDAVLSRASALGDSLYVYGGGGINRIVALTGKDDYRIQLLPIGGAPAATEDLIIAPGFLTAREAHGYNKNAALFAFDRDSTRSIWERKMTNPKTPIIDGGTVYIVDQDNQLQSINAEDGSLYWDFNLEDSLNIIGSPKITEDAIYFLGITAGNPGKYEVYSLSKNGNLRWVADATPDLSGDGYLQDYESLYAGNGIPILAGNFLIWKNLVQKFKDGDYISEYCLEAFNLETKSIALDYCVGEIPRINSKITDGEYVFVSTQNQILRYKAEEDELRQLSTITLEDNILDSVLTKDYIIAATDTGIMAIDRRNPDVRQKFHNFDYGKEIEGINMSISNGDLYVVVSPRGPDHILKFSPS